VDGAGVGNFLDLGRAASRAGDQLFFRLFLEVFKARKPALKTVFLLTDEIIDHHGS
jgi:hypothetical protein